MVFYFFVQKDTGDEWYRGDEADEDSQMTQAPRRDVFQSATKHKNNG